ncbi:MAG: NYN domain-containing protein [Chroococcidiopsidaceae cyanobacterium CP_BM_RX_35]|nr:NYN domain-containing protein [Chroococcidiopsidaceae cyanobacterium CP_BM_RX_35]
MPSEALNSPTDQNCIPNQGERGRVIIFIDGANLFYAASQLSIEIDYVKLLHYLTARDCLVHVFFYTGYDPTNEKQHGFLQWMRCNGFRVITKVVTQAPNSAKKANLDVEIAVDMMRLAQHCDTAVLVSGDGDFAYVVNTITHQGVRVEVVGLRSMTSRSLIDVANCYVDLAAIQQTIQKLDGSVCQQLHPDICYSSSPRNEVHLRQSESGFQGSRCTSLETETL